MIKLFLIVTDAEKRNLIYNILQILVVAWNETEADDYWLLLQKSSTPFS